jgi:putative membrane protein
MITTDARVVFAAERTLLAWQRSALALMGFGFVVERFGLFLQTITHQSPAAPQRVFSMWIGVALLLFGAMVALVSARHFHTIAKDFDASLPDHRLGFGVVTDVVVGLLALVLAGHILWTSH